MSGIVASSLVPTALEAVTGTYSYDPLFIKIDRENGKSRTYVEELNDYECVTDSTITITTDNKVYSVTDHLTIPEAQDTAYQYICVVEATKPINIFTSCVFAVGYLVQVPQQYDSKFSGVVVNTLPENESFNINCFNAVYVDYISQSAFAEDAVRENNGTICDFSLEHFTTPTDIIPHLYQYDQYTQNVVGLARPTYCFSSWNANLGDFLYCNSFGVGFCVNLGRSEEDSIVRVRLYKTTAPVAFIVAEPLEK